MARLEGEVDLFRVRGAELYLVGEKETTVLLQKGDMAVVLSHCPRCPALAVVVALVGDLHWPIARDSPAISLGDGRYAFSLPSSILYGLVLPTEYSTAVPCQMPALDDILRRYSTFGSIQSLSLSGDIGEINKGDNTTRENCNAWASLAPMIERELRSLVERKKILSSSALNLHKLIPHSKSKLMWSNTGVMNCQMLKRTQGAHRMSAVAKLISKMIVVGGIDVDLHVYPHFSLHGNGHMPEVAVASVNVFFDLLEAVESKGRSLFNLKDKNNNSSFSSSSSSVGLYEQLEDNINWTLNKEGLSKLLKVTSTSLKYYNNIGTQAMSSLSMSQLPSSSPYYHDHDPHPCTPFLPRHHVRQQLPPKENE